MGEQAREGVNPTTGAKFKIPAKKALKFRIAKAAKDAVTPAKKQHTREHSRCHITELLSLCPLLLTRPGRGTCIQSTEPHPHTNQCSRLEQSQRVEMRQQSPDRGRHMVAEVER
ncbi:MAG: HU family DNA-binding protein [Candidatus Sumerlaeia bacterium]|nr:HU family DNA-binding protein [Candidatus Sumerlaeia bacterium]